MLALRIALTKNALGDVHSFLYRESKNPILMFRRGIPGNNGYATTSGYWDPVLGLGTMYGGRFADTTTYAGVPGTSSNPGR